MRAAVIGIAGFCYRQCRISRREYTLTVRFNPDALRTIREARSITQQDLGDQFGRRSSINVYERGRSAPSLANIGRLAKLLDVPYTDLITEDESE